MNNKEAWLEFYINKSKCGMMKDAFDILLCCDKLKNYDDKRVHMVDWAHWFFFLMRLMVNKLVTHIWQPFRLEHLSHSRGGILLATEADASCSSQASSNHGLETRTVRSHLSPFHIIFHIVIHTLTSTLFLFFLGTRQELKVMSWHIRLHSLEMRGAAVPVILFNLFPDGGLE